MRTVDALEEKVFLLKRELNSFKEKLEDSWEEVKGLKRIIVSKDGEIKRLREENALLKRKSNASDLLLKDVLPKLEQLEFELRVSKVSSNNVKEYKIDHTPRSIVKPIIKKKKKKNNEHPIKDAHNYERKVINVFA